MGVLQKMLQTTRVQTQSSFGSKISTVLAIPKNGIHTRPGGSQTSPVSCIWSFVSRGFSEIWSNPNLIKSFKQSKRLIHQQLRHSSYRLFGKINSHLAILSEEFVSQLKALLVQRLRRGTQTAKLYHELGYDKHYVHNMLSKFTRRLLHRKKDRRLLALFGAVGFSWSENQITDVDVQGVEAEIEFVPKHVNADAKTKLKTQRLDEHFKDGWEKVIEKPNLHAWRKSVPGSSFYQYKVYGYTNDLPAEAFYHAQIDIDYRKQWDKHVISLDIIDRDRNTGNQVVRWVTHFPYPLYPREYVYIRRFKVDRAKNLLYTMCHSCEHPKTPITPDYVRVETYLSNMVIRPYTTFDENGFDFILTYYDEPKSNFPSMFYNYAASTGVPEFTDKMYSAGRYLHAHRNSCNFEDDNSGNPNIKASM